MELGNLYNSLRTKFPRINIMIFNNRMRVEIGGDIGFVYITEEDVSVPYRYYVEASKVKVPLMLSNIEWKKAREDEGFQIWKRDMTEPEFLSKFEHELSTMGIFKD